MKILDLDMDYFLDYPVFEICPESNVRVQDEACKDSVWTEARVRNFLESNLGLSRTNKIKGRIVEGHDQSLFF